MNFAHKLTLAVALLLCVTLSAGGAWTIGQNFSAALDAAASDAAVAHMRERYAVEDLLADSTSLAGAADAVEDYAGTLQLSGGGEGYRFAVLTGEGVVVWSDMPAQVTFADQWEAVQAGTGGMLYCGTKTARYLLLASPLQRVGQMEQGAEKGLYLVGGYDVTREFTEHGRQLRQYLAVECVALVLALTAAALLAWALTRPLRQLEAASRDIGAGQYDRRVAVSGGGEFARLAQGFNTMAGAVESNMEALRRQNESRTRFVAAFTHELKTPMTAILGYADLLRSGEQPADVRQLAADYSWPPTTSITSPPGWNISAGNCSPSWGWRRARHPPSSLRAWRASLGMPCAACPTWEASGWKAAVPPGQRCWATGRCWPTWCATSSSTPQRPPPPGAPSPCAVSGRGPAGGLGCRTTAGASRRRTCPTSPRPFTWRTRAAPGPGAAAGWGSACVRPSLPPTAANLPLRAPRAQAPASPST